MSQPKQFVPLKGLNQISEGRFLGEANSYLERLQTELLAYIHKYGDLAANAKAKLTLEIIVKCTNPKDELVEIGVRPRLSLPLAPLDVTSAQGAESDDGRPHLFVRRSGSSRTEVRQQVLCTEDGRPVDPESGEVLGD